MKFKYIATTEEAPEVTVIFGHEFILNGAEVEVNDEFVIKKLLGAAHSGIIPCGDGLIAAAPEGLRTVSENIENKEASQLPKVNVKISEEEIEEIKKIVAEKSGEELKKFVEENKIEVKALNNLNSLKAAVRNFLVEEKIKENAAN